MNVFPERIGRLEALARDLWWSWTPHARQVFRQLDYALWRSTAHNPVRMLQLLTAETLERAIVQPRVARELRRRGRHGSTRCRRRIRRGAIASTPELSGKQIAYFSAEFALHQSLPIYAGGLGVLAGDHCKEASDLGVPLIGVGFMYPQGYFHQSLTPRRLAAGGLREARIGRAPRSSRRSRRTASRASPPCRSATGRCSSRSGASASAASCSICSTPISKKTLRGIAICRRVCTAAIAKHAHSRRSSSASAACAC